jgi:hypothetical protein
VNILEETMTDQPNIIRRGVKATKIPDRSKSVGVSVNPNNRLLTPTQIKLQARLHSRLPEILQESNEAKKIFPDPVQALVDLFGSLPGDNDTWEKIIEEPYG